MLVRMLAGLPDQQRADGWTGLLSIIESSVMGLDQQMGDCQNLFRPLRNLGAIKIWFRGGGECHL